MGHRPARLGWVRGAQFRKEEVQGTVTAPQIVERIVINFHLVFENRTIVEDLRNFRMTDVAFLCIYVRNSLLDFLQAVFARILREFGFLCAVISASPNPCRIKRCSGWYHPRYWLSGVGGGGCGRRVASGGKDLLPAQSEQFPSIKICRL